METVAPMQFWSALGVGGALAAMIFHFYRKDTREHALLWKSQSEILIQALTSNTETMASMRELIKALHRRLDAEPAPDTSFRHRGRDEGRTVHTHTEITDN